MNFFFVKNVYICMFVMIVNDNTKYGVCVWIYIRAVYSICTYMHIQYIVGCILSSDSCKI